MDFFGTGGGKSDDIKAVLESLTTTIESINQRLAGGGGGGSAGVEDTSRQLRQAVTWLQYLSEQLKVVHQGQGELKAGLGDFKNEVNKTITDNLQSSMDGFRRVMQQMETGGSVSPQVLKESFTPAYMLDISKRLEQIILLNTEETELLRKQNMFLQQRLSDLEKKLDLLLGRKG
jgi:hypothetical protein